MSIDHVCANCGGPLRAQQAIYCTNKCRMKAYRARKSKRARPLDEQQLANVTLPGAPSGKLINANDLLEVVDMADVMAWSEKMQNHLKSR